MRGKSKYHSKKTVVDNIEFDSLKEANRYKKLKEQEQAGKIKGLRLQVKYEVIPKQVEVKERYSKKFLLFFYRTPLYILPDILQNKMEK
jgi:hypothetical protein